MQVMIKFIIQAAIFAFFTSVVHADSHSEEKAETEQKTVNSNSEERMNKVIALQEKREVLKKLNIAWAAYKNNEYQVAVDQYGKNSQQKETTLRDFFLG